MSACVTCGHPREAHYPWTLWGDPNLVRPSIVHACRAFVAPQEETVKNDQISSASTATSHKRHHHE